MVPLVGERDTPNAPPPPGSRRPRPPAPHRHRLRPALPLTAQRAGGTPAPSKDATASGPAATPNRPTRPGAAPAAASPAPPPATTVQTTRAVTRTPTAGAAGPGPAASGTPTPPVVGQLWRDRVTPNAAPPASAGGPPVRVTPARPRLLRPGGPLSGLHRAGPACFGRRTPCPGYTGRGPACFGRRTPCPGYTGAAPPASAGGPALPVHPAAAERRRRGIGFGCPSRACWLGLDRSHRGGTAGSLPVAGPSTASAVPAGAPGPASPLLLATQRAADDPAPHPQSLVATTPPRARGRWSLSRPLPYRPTQWRHVVFVHGGRPKSPAVTTAAAPVAQRATVGVQRTIGPPTGGVSGDPGVLVFNRSPLGTGTHQSSGDAPPIVAQRVAGVSDGTIGPPAPDYGTAAPSASTRVSAPMTLARPAWPCRRERHCASPAPRPRRPSPRHPRSACRGIRQRSVSAPATTVTTMARSSPSVAHSTTRTVAVQRNGGSSDSKTGDDSSSVNLDDLADQILRRIRGQLRIDRERRGSIADQRG